MHLRDVLRACMQWNRRQVPFSSNSKDISLFNSPSRHRYYVDNGWIQVQGCSRGSDAERADGFPIAVVVRGESLRIGNSKWGPLPRQCDVSRLRQNADRHSAASLIAANCACVDTKNGSPLTPVPDPGGLHVPGVGTATTAGPARAASPATTATAAPIAILRRPADDRCGLVARCAWSWEELQISSRQGRPLFVSSTIREPLIISLFSTQGASGHA